MGEDRVGRVLRRSARRTNLALLVVLIGAFLSGWLAFASDPYAWVGTAAHGLFGIGVVALLPWKSMIIRRAAALRLVSLALLLIIAGCLVAGFVQVFAGYVLLLGLTPIQVHVGAACIAVPLVVWHVLRSRRQRPRGIDLTRRALVQDGALAAATGLGYGLVAGAALLSRPTRPRAPTGSRPVESAPATMWLFDRTPAADIDFRVVVAGVPRSPAELAAQATVVRARLDCTNGWYADEDWEGVSLSALLSTALSTGTAASLRVRSVTGYQRLFPAADAERLWLAVRVQGRELAPGRGGPVRLVAPGRRGFWWVKWVASVELDQRAAWQQSPFPLQ